MKQNNSRLVLASEIDLGVQSPFERVAWKYSAILAHLHMGVRLTDKCQDYVRKLSTHPKSRAFFNRVGVSLCKPNQFGFTEMTYPEYDEVMVWLDSKPFSSKPE